jgi:hypothetical protein
VSRRWFSIAAGVALAAFVTARGIPTLRHDWDWPIDRIAVPSFLNESASGWLSVGFGVANPHPTTYLIGPPLAAVMWLFGPLAGLVLLSFATGYCCARATEDLAARWGDSPAGIAGTVLFVLFNPWVYNQVVAGHLVMVLAYGATIGMVAEMARGREASPVRVALWLVVIQAQLQFFIVAMIAAFVFAIATKKWLPVVAGAIVALPSIVGLVAERGTLLQIPYSVEWQANQSIAAVPLLSLGGYFAGYADRLGLGAQIAVWAILALAIAGIVAARKERAAIWAAAAGVAVYLITLGVHGPLAVPYEWIVRYVPESGVFRELYDLAGIFAISIAMLAAALAARVRLAGLVALAAGLVLPITWVVRPPSDLWISSHDYPHPRVSAAPFLRVALLPAFQPLQLRNGDGDGADPDVFVYPDHVPALNEYFPTYPVDMALASYEQAGDVRVMRALGVGAIVARPWLASRSNGGVGLAASSLATTPPRTVETSRSVSGATPLIGECAGTRVVPFVQNLAPCDIFFGDAPGGGAVRAVEARSDSIDPGYSWIDARLTFGRAPSLAQGLGGTITQSTRSHSVQPGSWLLAYVRGRLTAGDGRMLASGNGTYSWIYIPSNVSAVTCLGLCALAAESPVSPGPARGQAIARVDPAPFAQLTPWLYRVARTGSDAGFVRFNERYDPGWLAIGAWHLLPHVRVALYANGWFTTDRPSSDVILVQATALSQFIVECVGLACVLLLLKALVREPTKRA